ncbi:hypothetical protein ACJMK2_039617 [Sinanodonta woodiana]|uniref:Multivesicular body subunit 12A n=1 Tax=Sinanodonta woodiana TaxID=1069815 RepID=A0ABD3WGI8_SINWO
MDESQEYPITGVVVVADPAKCPPGYSIIDKTFDRREEADLWREGLFGRRVTRFLCVERSSPQLGKDVLVDVVIIQEKDPVPAGFTVVDCTNDTREKAVKRKLLCIRWMSCALTNDAISEIIFLSKGAKRPPNLYSLVGELSNLVLCYRMTPIKAPQSTTSKMANLNINLPYSMNPTQESIQQQGTYARQGRPDQPERSMSSLLLLSVTPLSEVPWQINPKISAMNNLRNFKIPEIRCKTMLDIEREYDYAFNVEKETKKAS